MQSFKRVAVDQSNNHIEQINLLSYINEVLQSMQPKLRHLQLTIDIKIDDDLFIVVSSGMIAQIITNLITNSVHHGFKGRRTGVITISAQKQGDNVSLTFEDNGHGMAAETLDKIFDPFFTTARAEGGSGLGMHIIYNLVISGLDGDIAITSQLGKGTEVTITFPQKTGSGV